jgi:hypothetical protein
MDKPYYQNMYGTSELFSDINSACRAVVPRDADPFAQCSANCREPCRALAANSCPEYRNKIVSRVKYAMLGAMPVLVFENVYIVFYARHVIAA